MLVCLLIVAGWVGSRVIGNIDKVFHGNIFTDVHALVDNTKLKGEDQGRVNILLAGDSADDPNHGGADLTDSIMVVSIDTVHDTGFMLSIPRDTWVDIPGIGHEKINAANEVTNFSQSGYPNGGMGQLEQIMSTDFGIQIDYYALIDYTAFKDAVDAVGGVTLTIQSPDPRGLYDAYTNLKLPNGTVTLNGEEALNLARARGDNAAGDVSYGFPNSDYDRTQHQRQLLTALEQKAFSLGVLSNPLKIGQLFNALGNNVQTDMNLADAIRAGQLAKAVNVQKLQSVTLGISGADPLLRNYTAPDGEEALIPAAGMDNFIDIQQYYQQLVSGNTSSTVAQEAPTAVVLNASDVTGLARKEATLLTQQGFNVVGVADANSEYTGSMVVDSATQKTASKQALQQALGSSTPFVAASATGEASEAQGYTADFICILGKNWNTTSAN